MPGEQNTLNTIRITQINCGNYNHLGSIQGPQLGLAEQLIVGLLLSPAMWGKRVHANTEFFIGYNKKNVTWFFKGLWNILNGEEKKGRENTVVILVEIFKWTQQGIQGESATVKRILYTQILWII